MSNSKSIIYGKVLQSDVIPYLGELKLCRAYQRDGKWFAENRPLEKITTSEDGSYAFYEPDFSKLPIIFTVPNYDVTIESEPDAVIEDRGYVSGVTNKNLILK